MNNVAALYLDEGYSGNALALVVRVIAPAARSLRVALPVLDAAARQQCCRMRRRWIRRDHQTEMLIRGRDRLP